MQSLSILNNNKEFLEFYSQLLYNLGILKNCKQVKYRDIFSIWISIIEHLLSG